MNKLMKYLFLINLSNSFQSFIIYIKRRGAGRFR